MPVLEATDSTYLWSTTSSWGVPLLTTLPKVVRTFEDFVKVDVYTGDSDPVYWAIDRGRREWGYEWASRFCVGMLTYYHTGTALEAAEYEGAQFWHFLKHAYNNCPRGSERRHFRGTAGLEALNSIIRFGNPETWFEGFPLTYKGIKETCNSQLSQFGPYFQLKVADYMDRCLELPIVSYRGLESNLPNEPMKAIQIMYPSVTPASAFLALCNRFSNTDIKAPPSFNRLIGPAEIETSLCGWKTTKYKGNWFGADILDKRNAVTGNSPKAEQFRNMFPEVINKDLFILEL